MFDYGDLRLMTLALVSDHPRNGYQIIKEIGLRFDGAYVPSPGAIYPVIAWLEDMGLVAVSISEGGQKPIAATQAGQAFLQANADDLATIWGRKHHLNRGQAPQEIVAAMGVLKAALGTRFSAQRSGQDITKVAAAIVNLATEIEGGSTSPPPILDAEIVTRHRFETRRRNLTVQQKEYLTPHMIRMVLSGPELADFVSLAPDDHIKLFFPSGGDKPLMRDYTPRSFDTAAQTLTLDFAVHVAGPATSWAKGAKVGDTLEIGGPRGSQVIASVFDWWVLIGDETALPAMGRRVQELAVGTHVITLAAVTSPQDEQKFVTGARHQSHWVHRPETAAANPAPLIEAAQRLTLPPGRGFVWIAAEASVARALKTYFLHDRNHPAANLKAAGYWVSGEAGADDKALD